MSMVQLIGHSVVHFNVNRVSYMPIKTKYECAHGSK